MLAKDWTGGGWSKGILEAKYCYILKGKKVKGGKNSCSPISLPVNRNSRITYFYPAMDELNS